MLLELLKFKSEWTPEEVAIALKLLPVFTLSVNQMFWWIGMIIGVAIALKLLPVFTLKQLKPLIWAGATYIVAIALKLLPVFTPNNGCSAGADKPVSNFCRNRPQALTCFHTVPVFNAGNLCLFKLQNTNLSF